MFLLSITINLSLLEDSLPYRNVLYYADWSIYTGQRNFYPSKIDANLISHLIFAHLDMDSNGDLVLVDEFADFQIITLPELEDGIKYGEPYGGVLGAIAILKVKYPHLKIGVSVGGITSFEIFSEVAKDKVKRHNFANSIVKFINNLGYDFVDIGYPKSIKEEDSDYAENFISLLQEIRNELNSFEKNKIRYELSVTMPISPILKDKIQIDKVLQIVSFINMKTYDLNGDWNSYTGHHTPLYTNEAYNPDTMPEAKLSIDSLIKHLENTYGNTIDMTKIIIGVAPYTRGWAGVKDDGLNIDNPGLYATANSSSVKSADGTFSGIYGFNELPTLIKQFNLLEYFDNTAKAAYYYSPNNGYFFSCDNEESVAAKGKYVKEKKLGGLASWMASYDPENIIARAMFNSLYEEGDQFPERDLIYNLISISCKITATDNG
jgi:chitinase